MWSENKIPSTTSAMPQVSPLRTNFITLEQMTGALHRPKPIQIRNWERGTKPIQSIYQLEVAMVGETRDIQAHRHPLIHRQEEVVMAGEARDIQVHRHWLIHQQEEGAMEGEAMDIQDTRVAIQNPDYPRCLEGLTCHIQSRRPRFRINLLFQRVFFGTLGKCKRSRSKKFRPKTCGLTYIQFR